MSVSITDTVVHFEFTVNPTSHQLDDLVNSVNWKGMTLLLVKYLFDAPTPTLRTTVKYLTFLLHGKSMEVTDVGISVAGKPMAFMDLREVLPDTHELQLKFEHFPTKAEMAAAIEKLDLTDKMNVSFALGSGEEVSPAKLQEMVEFMNTCLCKHGANVTEVAQFKVQDNDAELVNPPSSNFNKRPTNDLRLHFEGIPTDEEVIAKLAELNLGSPTGDGRIIATTTPANPAELKRIERIICDYLVGKGKPVINEVVAEAVVQSFADVKQLECEGKGLLKFVKADRDFVLPINVQKINFDCFPPNYEGFAAVFNGQVTLHDRKALIITIGEQVDQRDLRMIYSALQQFAQRDHLELKKSVVGCNWPKPWNKCMMLVVFIAPATGSKDNSSANWVNSALAPMFEYKASVYQYPA